MPSLISAPLADGGAGRRAWSIGLFQALTSVQEMTLTFVPKVGAMMVGVLGLDELHDLDSGRVFHRHDHSA